MRIVTVAEMREIEQRADQEYGLTSATLMEAAGQSLAEHLRAAVDGRMPGLEVLVLVGPGNNGGDGLVMGRHLASWGTHVAYHHWRERALEWGGVRIPLSDDLAALRAALARTDVVVDALLGTGHARPLDATMQAALALVAEERQRRPHLMVFAVDVPSGLNADTGALDEGTLPADLTVTLAFPKVGQLLFPGATTVGDLRVGASGLPPEMSIAPGMELLDETLLRPLVPARPLDGNKGTFGKVLVLAGSSLYLGAAYLATAAAARIGAGLVTLATTAERAPFYAMKLAEATYHLLPDERQAAPEERARALLAGLAGYRALVIGPGLGQGEETSTFLDHVFAGIRALPKKERPRLIVDADGLNYLAQRKRWWKLLPAGTIITPHPGEMTRLRGGVRVSGGEADRLAVAREAAQAWGVVVVLKGACTLVASPEGELRANWPGNPALATAGTGDVLSGTVGGLLAQGMLPFDAASAAVYVHSRAGLRVSARLGDSGLLASDLLDELPLAMRTLKGH